ncbi:hypothetical protein ST37_02595 [Vibrio sp. qd031]|uniref:NUDIX domain-containing protein n=1 Tax=Vibrio sp. qd031 TaxID=1603038 RepID=UPI000A1147FD|nr:NUDIX domain-containing protein [Vibrio sp. qd031]ORT52240.1 hypothetical protein ST37_02595 [Vibrio sp. qd031]
MKLLAEINQLKDAKHYRDVFVRDGAKGLAMHEDKLLLLKLRDGSYKIPGGGLKPNETVRNALIREFLEECGIAIESYDIRIAGKVHELKADKFEPDCIFSHTSYVATISMVSFEIGAQQLDDYEEKLGMHPVWVELSEVNMYLDPEGPHDWNLRDARIVQDVLFTRE